MAALFFAKDGSRPVDDESGPCTQSGPDIALSTVEALELLGNGTCLYCGRDAPSINPGPVSGRERHVILEIEPKDNLAEQFNQVGFYRLPDLSPAQAKDRLAKIRGAV